MAELTHLPPPLDPGRTPSISTTPPRGARFAAGAALMLLGATLAVAIAFSLANIGYIVALLVALALGVSSLWVFATNRRWRWPALVAVVLLIAGAVVTMLAADSGVLALVLVVVGAVLAGDLGTMAFRHEVHHAVRARWHAVPAAAHPVLLMNPKSGGGKVEQHHLVTECARRGIEGVVLGPGDDLRRLAVAAAERGADVLGMAGGDGSQALVASVAAAHGLAFVCIPAGTRNHLALDLGVDRDDVVGALDAFGPAREATIDLASVNGRTFVNNVSLGLYAEIVASEEYRDAKLKTAANMLEDLLGPRARPSGLALDGPGGAVESPQLVQVSNNPYDLTSLAGFGTRPRMDTGILGVATIRIAGATDARRLVALEAAGHVDRFRGWHSWNVPSLEVRSSGPVAAGVDGESCVLTPPLHFQALPGALRVRIARGHPGAAPAMTRASLTASTVVGLWALVIGRRSGLFG